MYNPSGPSAAAAASGSSSSKQNNSGKLIDGAPKLTNPNAEVSQQPVEKKKKKEGKLKRFFKMFQKACTNERDDDSADEYEDGSKKRPSSAPRRESFKGQRLIDAGKSEEERQRMAQMKHDAKQELKNEKK